MSKIPILNIYYLLSYSWDYLVEDEEVEVLTEDCHSVEELLARILTSGTQQLMRRGLDRHYTEHREETAKLRGRFDLTSSFSRQTMHQGRLVCEYDELSHDVLHNQILKTTLRAILSNPNLSSVTRNKILKQQDIIQSVSEVRITDRLFRRVRLHRNNRHYRLLMNVCELIHQSLLPTEASGNRRFMDFTRDEAVMHRLFESFVKNFYTRHSGFRVTADHLHWQTEGAFSSLEMVPRMETDVCLYSNERQIILDCKYYKEALKGRYKPKFNPNHLYQLFAYLENAQYPPKNWQNVEGILLYPAVHEDFQHRLKLNSYNITVASVDLGKQWSEIENALKAILIITR